MPKFTIDQTFKMFQQVNQSSRADIINTLENDELREFTDKYLMAIDIDFSIAEHEEEFSEYSLSLFDRLFALGEIRQDDFFKFFKLFLETDYQQHIINHMSNDQIINFILQPIASVKSWYGENMEAGLEVMNFVINKSDASIILHLINSIKTYGPTVKQNFTVEHIARWIVSMIKIKKMQNNDLQEKFINAIKTIDLWEESVSHPDIFWTVINNLYKVNPPLFQTIVSHIDERLIIKKFYSKFPDLSRHVNQGHIDALFKEPKAIRLLTYFINYQSLHKILSEGIYAGSDLNFNFNFTMLLLAHCSPVIVIDKPITFSPIFSDYRTTIETTLYFSRQPNNESKLITNKFLELELYVFPKPGFNKNSQFVCNLKKHIQNDFMFLHVDLWIAAVDRALKLCPGSDVKTMDQLLFIKAELYLNNYRHNSKNIDDFHKANLLYLKISSHQFLDSACNAIVGESLLEMANDQYYYINSSPNEKTYNSNIFLNLGYAHDTHEVLKKGIMHFYSGMQKLNKNENAFTYFMAVIENENVKIKDNYSIEEIIKKVKNKISILEKRSAILNVLGWHEISKCLIPLIENISKKPFIRELCKYKWQFEMAEPYSDKQKDIVDAMIINVKQHINNTSRSGSIFNFFASAQNISPEELLKDKLEVVKSQLNPNISNKKPRLS